jgi:hypothetical protein
MRRRNVTHAILGGLRRLLVALVVGLAASVGVAWYSALDFPGDAIVGGFERSWDMRVDSLDGTWDVAVYWTPMVTQHDLWLERDDAAPDGVDGNAPAWCNLRASDDYRAGRVDAVWRKVDARGWPLRCLLCEYEDTLAGLQIRWGVPLRPPLTRPRAFGALPMRPIVAGLAVNGLLYATACAGVAWLLGALRRILRSRRGLCVDCGHRLVTGQVRCPECGHPA